MQDAEIQVHSLPHLEVIQTHKSHLLHKQLQEK